MKKQILALTCAVALLTTGNGTCLKVEAAKKPISLSKKNITLKEGQTKKLNVKKIAKVKIKSKTFTSSNKKVATVTKKTGKIKAKKAGKATITVKVNYIKKPGKKKQAVTLKCKVTVSGKTAATQSKETAAANQSISGTDTIKTPVPTVGQERPTERPKPTLPVPSQKPETSEKPVVEVTPAPSASALPSSLPIPIPEKSGLYDSEGNVQKTWDELVEDGDVEIEDGSLRAVNASLLGVLVISETVTDISSEAFSDTKLVAIGIPGSVVNLGIDKLSIFYGCTSLVSVRLDEGVERIASHTFGECTNLLSVDLPNSLKSIGYDAFYGCSKLNEINIPDTVQEIGLSAFDETLWMKNQQKKNDFVVVNNILIRNGRLDNGNITIPSDIKCIGEGAFWDCNGLTGVTVSEGVQSVGDYAFYQCKDLSELNLPDSVLEVGYHAFEDTAWLEQNRKEDFAIANHVLVSYGTQSSGKITLPDNITLIAGGAFADCGEITGVNVPKGLLSVGSYAFDGCSSMQQINLPAGVKTIGDSAFSGCESLVADIPEEVDYIGDYAFSYCDSIESATIPANISMGEYVFTSCGNLKTVNLEYGIEEISWGLFSGCKSLTDITIPSSVTDIGGDAFGNSGLVSITIPSSVVSIGAWAFSECENLLKIQVPDNVKYIGAYAFDEIPLVIYSGNAAGSPWGADMVLPSEEPLQAGLYDSESGTLKYSWEELIQNDYIRVDDGVLTGNVGDEDWENEEVTEALAGYLVISDTVSDIGQFAFGFCGYLTAVYIPGSVSGVGTDAFSNCVRLRSVVMAEGVADIEPRAFDYCIRLSNIIMPQTIIYIGRQAFRDCSWVTISVPDSVAMIEDDAFADVPLVIYDGLVLEKCPWGAEKVQNSDGLQVYP